MYELVVRKQCPAVLLKKLVYRSRLYQLGAKCFGICKTWLIALGSQHVDILSDQGECCFNYTRKLQMEANNFQVGATDYLAAS